MKLSEKQLLQLQNAIEVTKLMGIESVMVSEGKIRGSKASHDAAIISDLDLGLPDDVKIGVGRVDELLSRLAAFDGATADITVNPQNEASIITIKATRSKLEFRCTAPRMIAFPKQNDDPTNAVITMTATEVKQLTKAISIMGTEHVVFQLMRNGDVRIETMDAVRDKYEAVLENKADVVGEHGSFVFTYLSKLLAKGISGAQVGEKPISLLIGESGSITMAVKDHNIIVIPQLGDDENDDY